MFSRPSRPLAFLLLPGLVAFSLAGCVIPSRSDPPELSHPDLKCADTDGFRDVAVTVTPGLAVRTAGAERPPLQDESDVPGAAIPFTPIEGIADVVEQFWEIDEVAPEVGDDGVTRWIVQIPSTQSWNPSAGPAANDLSACLIEMGGRNSTLEAAVREAMRQAKVPHGAPVMLNGFSLGGITAGHLASDPSFTSTYDVEAVLTAGAPVARFDIDDDIQVLSLEHEDDLVAHVEGYDNPDRLNWTTLTGATPYMVDENGIEISAHSTQTYAETAIAAQNFDARSVRDYMDTAELFFNGEQTVKDFRAERT